MKCFFSLYQPATDTIIIPPSSNSELARMVLACLLRYAQICSTSNSELARMIRLGTLYTCQEIAELHANSVLAHEIAERALFISGISTETVEQKHNKEAVCEAFSMHVGLYFCFGKPTHEKIRIEHVYETVKNSSQRKEMIKNYIMKGKFPEKS